MTEDELLAQYGYVAPKQAMTKPVSSEVDLAKYGYVPPESEESFGKSAAMALPRIGYDLGNSILERIRAIPSYIEKGKTEIPGLKSAIQNDPKHLLGQALAGTNETINTIAQSPLNLAKYGSNRLHLLPESVPAGVSALVPEDTTQAIHDVFGEPQQEGEALARGIMRNMPAIVPGIGAARALNPLKLTSKNIAKDVIKTRNAMQDLYNEKYTDFLNNAHQSGAGQTLPNAATQIDFKTALINEPKKVKTRIDEFETNPNVLTAHEAKKDLLKIQRKLTAKNESVGLIGNESSQLDAVNDAVNKIESNMFTDQHGVVNPEMANQYRQIQEGYKKEVIPYTKNKAINEFRRGDKLADQLVKSLQSGKFPAQRGKEHKALMIRREFGKHPIISGAAGLGSVGGLAALLYKALAGGQSTD